VITVNTIVRFVLRVVVIAVIFYVVDRIVGGIHVDPNTNAPLGVSGTYLWIALIFALVNTILGPVFRLLSLPFVIITLGLFLLVVNAALLGITAALSDRLQVDSFGAAVAGGFLIALFSWIAELVLPLEVK
jgi:putative membrane protein